MQGRDINYMRISITDRCNLRCKYCMPDGIELLPMNEILTFEEILRVCEQAVGFGITRFKITGGEPLVRRGCADLIRKIKKLPGVERVTMTTNGYAAFRISGRTSGCRTGCGEYQSGYDESRTV